MGRGTVPFAGGGSRAATPRRVNAENSGTAARAGANGRSVGRRHTVSGASRIGVAQSTSNAASVGLGSVVGVSMRQGVSPRNGRVSADVPGATPSSSSSVGGGSRRNSRGSSASASQQRSSSVNGNGRPRRSQGSGGGGGGGSIPQAKARQLLDDAATACEEAFQANSAASCQEAIYRTAASLAQTQSRALASPEAARFCAMIAALVQHPKDSCRAESVRTAAQILDVSTLLRVAPRCLNGNQIDIARRLQAAGNVLKAARCILTSDQSALDRCRVGGGILLVVDIWRQAIAVSELAREAAQVLLIFARGHPKAVANAGAADCIVASMQKLPPVNTFLANSLTPPLQSEDVPCDQSRELAEKIATPDCKSDVIDSLERKPTETAIDVVGKTSAPSRPLSCAAPSLHSLPCGLQLYSELLSLLAPHVGAQKLVGVIPHTLQTLAACVPHGPVRALPATLQLMAKMSYDSSLAKEFVRLNAPHAIMELLGLDPIATSSVGMRRALANAWIHMTTCAVSDSRRQLATAPRVLGVLMGFQNAAAMDDEKCAKGVPATPAAVAGASTLGRIPEPVAPEVSMACAKAGSPPAPLLSSTACAVGLRKRLLEHVGFPADRIPVYPVLGSSGEGAVINADGIPLLRFDASFEGANLRAVAALSSTRYELQLSVDIYNSAHCQWFYFRVSGMRQGVTYTFHLVNLSKPSSLFEEGAQPVVFSKQRLLATGVGWTREGLDVAYYANGAMLSSGKFAYTLSFSIAFPHANDEVSIAHFFPYSYSDLRRDMSLWSFSKSVGCSYSGKGAVDPKDSPDVVEDGVYASSTDGQAHSKVSADGGRVAPRIPPVWHVQRRQLLQTPGGLAVETFCVGAPAGTRPLVLLVARAHPGESPASWVMRGACDFLFGDGSDEARACRMRFTWVVVPMLNPDGVVVGNTRTNFSGVDLNRHHHDDQAQETCALRALLTAATSEAAAPPLVFVDMHGHSRRRGVFAMGNAGSSARLPCLLAKRSPLFDFAGSSMNSCDGSGKDSGVGRVAMANCGVPHSFTLEASFGAPHGGCHQLTPGDLESLGRDLCLSIVDLADGLADPTSAQPLPGEAALMSQNGGGDDE